MGIQSGVNAAVGKAAEVYSGVKEKQMEAIKRQFKAGISGGKVKIYSQQIADFAEQVKSMNLKGRGEVMNKINLHKEKAMKRVKANKKKLSRR